MPVPLLPETAPFSPAQRAWLNGFFAGLLGLDGAAGPDGAVNGQAAATALVDAPASVVEEEEDFPWHDPALPIAERLELAEGKPIERKLMAAMAQLDCGACGYLCQTYSEAIASGEEKDLKRCTPGGSETSRKLKELLAGRSVAVNGSTTNGAAKNGIAKNGAPPAASTFSRSNPFAARLVESRPLNREGSKKDTRHVVIDLAGSGLAYKPGDALGLFPENCPDLVDELLEALGAAGRLDGRSTLIRECALSRPTDELLELLVECATDPEEAAALKRLQDGEDDWIDTADLLDVLHRHRSARPDLDRLLALLGRLQPRLYSISSSPRAHPDQVHLTVGTVRFTHGGRARKGVASTFMADRLDPGAEVKVYIQPSHRFQLPDHGETPMIMVGPGTGIAPFRAFLEERAALGASGKNWLFFGDQSRATDFLYEEELAGFQRAGLLTRLDTAFSRDQAEKVYVQDRMLEKAPELWQWLEEGAHVYVCGDAKRMASDVDRALNRVIAGQGGISEPDAKAYVASLTKAGRYQRDVY